MLIDVNRLQTVVIILSLIAVALLGIYWLGYTAGQDAQILKYQKEALTIAEEVSHTAVVVQQEMEKTNEKLEKASSISDECNFVLNYDLTPCGVFD